VYPNGATNFHSLLTVVGTADGCGTGTMRFVVDGRGDGPMTEGRFRTIDQSEATVDVHAVLDFVAFVLTGTITTPAPRTADKPVLPDGRRYYESPPTEAP
jgi:hypothetical protein